MLFSYLLIVQLILKIKTETSDFDKPNQNLGDLFDLSIQINLIAVWIEIGFLNGELVVDKLLIVCQVKRWE